MIWGQLAIKAALSGAMIAAASELARRSPGIGGLIASLPLTTLLAFIWLWRDGAETTRAADFVLSTCLYVIASLPALASIAILLRKGAGFPLSLACGIALGAAGYFTLIWAGKRFGLPV